MLMKDHAVAAELKAMLAKKVNLVDFKIFGSRARGDGLEYSDMDVFLEVDHITITKQLKEDILDIVWEVGFKHGLVISPLIFTKDEITNSPLRSSPIVRNIMEEGVTI